MKTFTEETYWYKNRSRYLYQRINGDIYVHFAHFKELIPASSIDFMGKNNFGFFVRLKDLPAELIERHTSINKEAARRFLYKKEGNDPQLELEIKEQYKSGIDKLLNHFKGQDFFEGHTLSEELLLLTIQVARHFGPNGIKAIYEIFTTIKHLLIIDDELLEDTQEHWLFYFFDWIFRFNKEVRTVFYCKINKISSGLARLLFTKEEFASIPIHYKENYPYINKEDIPIQVLNKYGLIREKYLGHYPIAYCKTKYDFTYKNFDYFVQNTNPYTEEFKDLFPSLSDRHLAIKSLTYIIINFLHPEHQPVNLYESAFNYFIDNGNVCLEFSFRSKEELENKIGLFYLVKSKKSFVTVGHYVQVIKQINSLTNDC